MSKKKKKKTGNDKIKQLAIKYAIYTALAGVGIFLLFILLIRIGAFGKLPSELELKQVRNNQATEIFSVDNKLLGRYYYQNRTKADLDEIPTHFINALIATEDVRFYKHSGVDFRSTMRVLIKSIILFNKSAGGGSTISQQLAKNVYPRKSFGPFTLPVAKVKEIMKNHEERCQK